MALMPATTVDPNTRGRPQRGRSQSPSRPSKKNRFLHFDANVDTDAHPLGDVDIADTFGG